MARVRSFPRLRLFPPGLAELLLTHLAARCPRRWRQAAIQLLVLFAACRQTPAAPARITVVDDAGDTVRLAAPAHRVVSLMPATTEILFAIGAGSATVGRTTWCDYPTAALQVPSVGDGLDPNLEAVVARRPDLVILYRSAANRNAASRLADLHIPSVTLSVDRLEDVPRVARILGALTGHAAAADSLARDYDTRLQQATVPPPAHPPGVLLLAWDQPPITIGGGSFLSEMITRAGGRNIFADITAPSAPVSLEAIVARDPDLVLAVGSDLPAIARRPEWQSVRAVRQGHFVLLDGSEFARPTPRAPAAIRRLAQALRPVEP